MDFDDAIQMSFSCWRCTIAQEGCDHELSRATSVAFGDILLERVELKPQAMSIANTPTKRLFQGTGRALRRKCPYCGGGNVFNSWFEIKKQCPTCGVTYAYESGYFLGSYPVNLVITELIAVAIVVSLIIWSDLSILQMQIAAVFFAVGLPLLGYPFSLLLWVAIDVAFHPPDPHTGKRAL